MDKLYKVVAHKYNSWRDFRWVEVVYENDNLLKAYEHLLELEGYDKALAYHDAGSPISVIYKIDTYLSAVHK